MFIILHLEKIMAFMTENFLISVININKSFNMLNVTVILKLHQEQNIKTNIIWVFISLPHPEFLEYFYCDDYSLLRQTEPAMHIHGFFTTLSYKLSYCFSFILHRLHHHLLHPQLMNQNTRSAGWTPCQFLCRWLASRGTKPEQIN